MDNYVILTIVFIFLIIFLVIVCFQDSYQYLGNETFEDDIPYLERGVEEEEKKNSTIYKEKTLENCLQLCKETKNCYGSVYTKSNGKCLLSRNIINKENQLVDDNIVCVKPYNIYESDDNYPSLVERRRNSVFVCSEKANDFPKYYFHNNGKLHHTYEKIMLDGIHDVDNYTVKNYLY